jgi:hypothetical protein
VQNFQQALLQPLQRQICIRSLGDLESDHTLYDNVARDIAMDDINRSADATKSRAVDRAVGQQIERALTLRDVSLVQLAAHANVPLDELHACCAGLQRASAKTLCDIASVLQLPVSFFFDPLLRIKQ